MGKHPIVINIGQFGCQLGSHMINIASSKKFCPFLTKEGYLSFIFVDTEAKVINDCINRPCYSRYIKKENLIVGNGLASGNWLKASKSEKLICCVLQQVRDEVMKCHKEFCKGLIFQYILTLMCLEFSIAITFNPFRPVRDFVCKMGDPGHV